MEIDLTKLLDYKREPIAFAAKSERDEPFAYIPNGFDKVSLEEYLAKPIRKRALVILADSPSFIEYLNLHKSKNSVLYANANFENQSISVTANIDDHGSGLEDASWREHKAVFSPEKTLEWKTWNARNKNVFSQGEFADFIEDNLSDIQQIDGSPSGSDMLEMALKFESTKDHRFVSKINQQNGGVDLEFKSTDEKETVERMKMFLRFSLGIRVFINGSAYPLVARLKYRQQDGKLVFWYELIRPDLVFKTAIDSELTAIYEQTKIILLNGRSN